MCPHCRYDSKGSCPVCRGKGTVSYDMAFAKAVEVVCEECQGRRYNPTALGYVASVRMWRRSSVFGMGPPMNLR